VSPASFFGFDYADGRAKKKVGLIAYLILG
jgi:hypothetical protein